MKKSILSILFCVIIASCTTINTNDANEQMASFATNDVYANDAERYRQNVSIKEQGDSHIVYEYKDVRIDELAVLAIKYCEDNAEGTNAVLREIILYRNNLRRATFDCQNLAIAK